jgi:hypothetical protein
MKHLLRLLPLFALAFVTVRAAEDPAIAGVRSADAERVAATKAADRTRLQTVLSDDLRYAHSSGKVDTKASYIESLVSHATVYESVDYKEQNFKLIAPGIVTMSGRAVIKAGAPGAVNELDLNFLAIWRQENGHWRFIAWQSNKLVPPAAKK